MPFRIVMDHVSTEAWEATVNRKGCGNAIRLVRASKVPAKGTVCENKLWRVDVQNTDGKVKNLQVQRNDIWGKKSTVGGVLFPAYLLDQIGSVNATGSAGATALARDKELTGAIQKSLVDSVGTWQLTQAGQKLTASFTFFRIEGDFSS